MTGAAVSRETATGSGDAEALSRQALIVSGASAGALVVLWLLFVELEWGQRLDDLAIQSRAVESPAVIAQNSNTLGLITHTSLALGILALLGIGFIRKRPLLGVAAAGSVAAAVLTTEGLKKFVIDRPIRFEEVPDLAHNTFPSGHATISTSLALAALMLAPVRLRVPVAVVGALWVSFQCTGVVSAGWHRPSDALAGLAVALGWAAFAVFVLASLGRVERATSHGEPEGATHWALVVFVALLAALVVSVVVAGDSPWSWGGFDFVLSSAIVDAAAIGVVVVFTALLRGWSPGRVPTAEVSSIRP